jgi:hypothetical protein
LARLRARAEARFVRIPFVVMLPVVTLACGTDGSGDPAAERRAVAARDSGFAATQDRGARAMGVDQYTSTHVFEPLPDGGRIVLQRDVADSVGTIQIREHMHAIARAFGAGGFQVPGFVHAQDVPGTAVMAERRAAITYSVDTVARGAVLRLRTADAAAVQAIHEFLAFQRRDHHAGAHVQP